jgi:hypothetical protein
MGIKKTVPRSETAFYVRTTIEKFISFFSPAHAAMKQFVFLLHAD